MANQAASSSLSSRHPLGHTIFSQRFHHRMGGSSPSLSQMANQAASSPSSSAPLLSESGWVEARTRCDHLDSLSPDLAHIPAPDVPCNRCQQPDENWLCLGCKVVLCSRYVNKHMLQHYQRSNHSLALCYSDLSVWCYSCEAYLAAEVIAQLQPVYRTAYKQKFGETPPIQKEKEEEEEDLLLPYRAESGWVEAQTRCDHLDSLSPDLAHIPTPGVPCNRCQQLDGNWLCLGCKVVLCSRYVNKHMLQHYQRSNHSLALRDLSVWCYSCDAYLATQVIAQLRPVFRAAYKLKFGEAPPIQKEKEEEEEEEDLLLPYRAESGWVEARTQCDHLDSLLPDLAHIPAPDVPCNRCQQPDGNWLCLGCKVVLCSRYVNKHMLQHYQRSNHSLALCYSDLSVWCYSCEAYLAAGVIAQLRPVYRTAYKQKFGETPPIKKEKEEEEEDLLLPYLAESGWVEARTRCDHLDSLSPDLARIPMPNVPCNRCQQLDGNWLCLGCKVVLCSRYVNKHMLQHYQWSNHSLALRYSDLSVWCYSCDAYLATQVIAQLWPVCRAAYKLKFGEAMPIKKEKEEEEEDLLLPYRAESGWVEARTRCDHLDSLSPDLAHIPAPDVPCNRCQQPDGNWLCLGCKVVLCSRYVNKHMLQHYQRSNHSLALCYSDLSVWCYSCEAYLAAGVIAQLRPVYRTSYKQKFGETPPIKKEKKGEEEDLLLPYRTESGWVEARTRCDHLDSLPPDLAHIPTPDVPCNRCQQPDGNWLCLGCKVVLCSRYVNKHMLQHYQRSNHSLALCYSDLSVWCYSCEAYLAAEVIAQLRPVYRTAYKQKFGETPPIQKEKEEEEEDLLVPYRAESGWVEARTRCNHLDSLSPDLAHIPVPNVPCNRCQQPDGNWLCLGCKVVLCSRYVNKHMLQHYQRSNHSLALCYSDLSVWCYSCEAYLATQVIAQLWPVYRTAYKQKFGETPPIQKEKEEEEEDLLLPYRAESGWVEARTRCDHLDSLSPDLAHIPAPNVPCNRCQQPDGNWLCLGCKVVLCSRYVNKHMLQHYQRSNHSLALCYSDLSVWCYSCEAYLAAEVIAQLRPVYRTAYKQKFGETPPIKKEKEEEEEDLLLPYLAESGWVEARTRCDHLDSLSPDLAHIPTPDVPCNRCQHPDGNWLCLGCKVVLCSRYVNKHMLQHYQWSNHSLVLRYSDLSVWCYSCDAYLAAQVIAQLRPACWTAYKLKFGEAPPIQKEKEEELEDLSLRY